MEWYCMTIISKWSNIFEHDYISQKQRWAVALWGLSKAFQKRHSGECIISSACVLKSFTTSNYSDVIMDTMASQITSLPTVYSTVYSDADQRKHQSFASLGFVRGIHRWPVNSPNKSPVTRKIFPSSWSGCPITIVSCFNTKQVAAVAYFIKIS